MPAAAIVPRALSFARPCRSPASFVPLRGVSLAPFYLIARTSKPPLIALVAASAASFDELNAKGKSHQTRASKKSILLSLTQEIEPLDVSLIQKDVPADTLDAMKRTISSMLGLLPSDQFNVVVKTLWDPLFKLLVSSMTTGYTLRNAEYRLCLERNLGVSKELSDQERVETAEHDDQDTAFDGISTRSDIFGRDDLLHNSKNIVEASTCDSISVEALGAVTAEAREYIVYLQSRLSSTKKELHDVKRKNAALQMQHFVGEEKNDLLDYLRSLKPEKVVELSEPACPGVQETIHSVAHGLLATLSLKMHSKAPPPSENASGESSLGIGKDDCAELVENTSLQFQPLIAISRDYLARLLFWCILLGHYLRGLEYRLELMQLLTVSSNAESLP